MLNILFVVLNSIESNSSSSFRNKAIIRGLYENNYSIDLITLRYNNKLQNDWCNNIHYLDNQSYSIKTNNKLRSKLYLLKSKFSIYDGRKKLISKIDELANLNLYKYDYIISSSDPKSSHLFAYHLLKRDTSLFSKWIQVWGDPFFDDISVSSFLKRRIKCEEKKLLDNAHKVFYVSPFTLEKQKMIYESNANKMLFIPIPFMEPKIFGDNEMKPMINILYAGDYYKKIRNIIPLYECAKTHKNIKLVICGDSDIKLVPQENIEIYNRMDKDDLISKETEANIIIHLCNDKGTQIPGKIYQYSGTNKNILFILDGDHRIEKYFIKFNRYVFALNTKDDIFKSIMEIFEGKHIEKKRIVEEFSPKMVVRNMISMMEGKYNEN